VIDLTPDEIEDILTADKALFCPDLAGIKKGDRFHLWAKVGGDMQLVSVVATSDPYKTGPKAIYVDVFGYDYRGSVNVKKLLTEHQAREEIQHG
jgi:hypothetical protein